MSMSLKSFSRGPTVTETGVEFAMSNSATSKTVRVIVWLDALPPGAPHAAFDANRKRIEEIAKKKYDRGLTEANGSILVTANDMYSMN
jgi:hypothetical protein